MLLTRYRKDVQSAKLTSKHQTTIPADVRSALGLKAGDRIGFAIEGDRVRLHKVDAADEAWARLSLAQMVEWGSAADDEAFRDP